MSHHEEPDYSKKGAFFGKFVLFLILFVILVIWVYNKNWVGLN